MSGASPSNQPTIVKKTPALVVPSDLTFNFGGSKLAALVASGEMPARDAAKLVADLLEREAAALRSGRRSLFLSSPYECRLGDTPLVDSLEFQRASILAALTKEEARISAANGNGKAPIGLENTVIIGGPRSMILARQVAVSLGLGIEASGFHQFPDSEFKFKVQKSVRNQHVYIVMSTGAPAADNILGLCLLASALFRAKAASITAVIPLFGFGRQDRRDKGQREPISAEVCAKLLEKAGVGSTITVDLHAQQEEGFFKRLDQLYASSVVVPWVKQYIDPKSSVMLAPDAGSIKRAESYGSLLGIKETPVWIHKERVGDSNVKMSKLAGSVSGKTVIIADDLVSTGGTIVEASSLAKKKGALRVIVIATHPVFAADAYERLRAAPIEKIIVADTVPVQFPTCSKFEVVPTAPLLAEAIRRDHTGESVSGLLSHTFNLKDLLAPWLTFNPLIALQGNATGS